jgi:hypothetical protein
MASVATPKDVAEMIVDLLKGAGKKAPEILRIVGATLPWTNGAARQLVEGMADNRVSPDMAESAMLAMAEKCAEYVGDGAGEEAEEATPAPSPVEAAAALANKNGQPATA